MFCNVVRVQENQVFTDSTTMQHLFDHLQMCPKLLLILCDCHAVGALGVPSKEGHWLVEAADLTPGGFIE